MSELNREQLLMSVIAGNGAPYLRGIDLSNIDLSRAGWLTEADLRHANLANANLARADLRNTRLEMANMHSSNLAGSDLEGADLTGAKLDVANLRMANLKGAILKRASLVGAALVKVNLEGANLEEADLEGANLGGANLKNARLHQANLKMANLSGVDLSGAVLLGTVFDWVARETHSNVPSHGFTGAVDSIQLTDLIQLLCLSNSDVLIRVESSQGRGEIHVKAGRVYHAEHDGIQGEPAFLEMLQWSKGRFETSPLRDECLSSIEKPLEHLLLESLRRRDEKVSNGGPRNHSNLLRQIREYTPIPAYPSRHLMESIGSRGKALSASREIQISDAFDSDESGNILCSVLSEDGVFIAPLNYLTIKQDHPLFEQIQAYQHGCLGTERST